jgi:putative chitinase
MTVTLTPVVMRRMLPRAPAIVLDAFVARQDVLVGAGITASVDRMAFFFANLDHECGGFALPDLTESLAYTPTRMAEVWPNRFKNAAAVIAKYGSAKGWQKRAFDDIYGSRMGNRPGTSDGSIFIGRGGPQWTGRDGYAALERLTDLPATANPAIASRLDLQPDICAAFWTWKGLNACADANDFLGCVKRWNGGTNGLADRRAKLAAWRSALRDVPVVNVSPVGLPPVMVSPPLAPGMPKAKPTNLSVFIAAVIAAFRRT